jgi:phosphatidylserine decarboxylase
MAADGLRFLVPAAALAMLGFGAGWPWLAWPALAAAAFVASFFRDPERAVPPASDAVLAPADGRIVEVGPFSGWRGAGDEPLTQIAIFMSPLDVHVNRAPAAGTVEAVEARPGRFLAAWQGAASLENEQTLIRIRTAAGPIWMKQIAGLLARRIVTWVGPGDTVEAGERIGLIRFGSRVDLILPARYAVRVQPGQRSVAGVTVMATCG